MISLIVASLYAEYLCCPLAAATVMDPDFDVQNIRSRPKADILTLEPAPHARAVVAIDVTELALEIGFLTRDYAVADDEGEGCQCQQQPEAVEVNGQADEPQHHAEINGITRQAVRAGIDDGRARQTGGYIRAGPGHGHDRPGEQRQRKGKHQRSQPACRYRGRNEWQGQEPVEREPGKHRDCPRDRRPNNDIRRICCIRHAGLLNQTWHDAPYVAIAGLLLTPSPLKNLATKLQQTVEQPAASQD